MGARKREFSGVVIHMLQPAILVGCLELEYLECPSSSDKLEVYI